MFANPFRDALRNAMSDCDEIRGNDAPGLAEPNCLAGRFLLLTIAAQSPVRQLMLDSWRDEKTRVVKPLLDYGNRVNDVVQAVGEVEKNIGVNGDGKGVKP